MRTRTLLPDETGTALNLAWKVFQRFEAPEYSEEGVASFQKTIHDPQFTGRIRCYGAFDGERLIGMLATRSEGTHIALFFVEETYHRQGVGKGLFEAALSDLTGNRMTVNASPYAVPVYRRLGFVETKPEQLTDGIRYTPMCYTRQRG